MDRRGFFFSLLMFILNEITLNFIPQISFNTNSLLNVAPVGFTTTFMGDKIITVNRTTHRKEAW